MQVRIQKPKKKKLDANRLKPDMQKILQKVNVQQHIGLIRLNGNDMKVKAPDGYHWMKAGKEYKLMKDPASGYKPHKGATKSANFMVQKTHKK